MLVYDVIQKVCDMSTFRTKMNLLMLNKYTNKNLKIYSFYDILVYSFNGVIEKPHISHIITSNVLKRFKYLQVLNISMNNKISDEDIKHMNLHTLYTNAISKISDK